MRARAALPFSVLMMALLLQIASLTGCRRSRELTLATADEGAMPTLVRAAKRGDAAAVKALLEKGENPNATTSSGSTALHFAAYEGRMEILKQLLAAGASPNIQANDGWTPLHSAVQSDNVKIVEALIEAGADLNVCAQGKVTPLLASINMATGKPEITMGLIRAGADVNLADSDGNAPINVAATESTTEVMEALLKSGANPNNHTKDGFTALHSIAQNGDTFFDRAELLLRYEADPTIRDERGKTPLDLVPANAPKISALFRDHNHRGGELRRVR